MKSNFLVGLTFSTIVSCGVTFLFTGGAARTFDYVELTVLSLIAYALAYWIYKVSSGAKRYVLSIFVPSVVVALLASISYRLLSDFLFSQGDLAYSDGPMFSGFVVPVMTLFSLPGMALGVLFARYARS